MKASKSREVHSTEFGFKENTTMVSYLPKKGKAVILLSTMHHDMSVDEESEKPDFIKYYNGTKCDLMDQMVRTYYCKRQSRMWPMVLWYNALDGASLNAHLLYTSEHPECRQGLTHKRRLFLQELVREKVTPHMRSRLEGSPGLQKSLEKCGVAMQAHTAHSQEQGQPKKKRCHYCPSKKDCKSSMTCMKCECHVCKGAEPRCVPNACSEEDLFGHFVFYYIARIGRKNAHRYNT
ncbi:piggyBac transposable element-derived protein 4-like [Acipenser oxyrinchus oxyrinchus]|uniref:PiggyBac transposable element-derived protein 4-like n=1 Tax=Acipenser oxyrinchus oxyrinchus TaxID=40147 RepID=A0AAD8FW11_ACIOX|nr:piggyBac transposable element-derived protein 4-like [Acipenser oxyrinchus oxyrinchus]